MTAQDQGPEVAVLSTTINSEASPYVDWPAIVAGAVLASAISFVLFAFGTGIGLSITSPYPSESVSAPIFAIVLSLWILLVTVMSFLAGGYFTGLLMRRRALPDHEQEMRDGMHGALTWALGILLGALIAAWTVAGTARTATEAAANASGAAGPRPRPISPIFSCGPTIPQLSRLPKPKPGVARLPVSSCAILLAISPRAIAPISAEWSCIRPACRKPRPKSGWPTVVLDARCRHD